MTAGRLRHVLVYQVQTAQADALGQPRPSWSNHSIHRGQVRAARGNETVAAQQVVANVEKVVETRYPGYQFSPANRVVDLTDTQNPVSYEITSSVDPDGRRRSLLTRVVESVPAPAELDSLLTEGGNLIQQEDGDFLTP